MERTGKTSEIKNFLVQPTPSTPEKKWENSDEVVILTEDEKDFAYAHALEKKIRENPAEIVMDLTEEEKFSAWDYWRNKKIGLINLGKYWQTIKNPPPPKVLTAEELYKLAMRVGRNRIEGWLLNDDDRKIYGLLALYFCQDKRFESYGYSLKKGLCLYGNKGCGKTTAMDIFRTIVDPPFSIPNCEVVSREYKKNGPDVIDKYIGFESVCFDDLGTEPGAKHWGNESNVIREIINGRYDKEKYRTFKTHITTNLSAEMIGSDEYYGERFRDRCRQMFNQIEFPKDAKSKRK